MKKYKSIPIGARRFFALFSSLALVFGIAAPILISGSASAAGSGGQITSRSITLSNAAPGATNVSYELTFTPFTSESGGSMIVDFCGDTPIIGAPCAFSSSTVPTVPSTVTASTGTVSTVGTTAPVHTIQLTGITLTAGTAFTVTFGGLTNPSTATSFYARILTYASTGSSAYVPASTSGGSTTTGSYVDWGGDALSTTSTIPITAIVMEQLTFCVSAANLAPTSTCSSATAPNVSLGQLIGSTYVLSSTTVSTSSVYTQLSTNALNGAVIDLEALNSCSGLSSTNGTTCGIPGIGAFAAPASGQAFFGLNVSDSTNNTSGSGTITPDSNYGPTAGSYGMGSTTGNNVNSTYGAEIASTTAPCSLTNNTLTWAAQSSNTTPAGIYTAYESLIATGTF